jgi:L-rhamnose isomerase
MNPDRIRVSYDLAKDAYAELGIDVEAALEILTKIPLSLHCWQGDDVGGFEQRDRKLGGGLAVTGSHPGKARTAAELRQDLDLAFALIPGPHRLNLHAIYGEFGTEAPDRDRFEPGHFRGWVEWAQARSLKLDFNATCFSHPLAEDGLTLSHPDKKIRLFWIAHVKACRRIAAHWGRELKSPSLHNLWIPDGLKEAPADRGAYRSRLRDSLDEIFEVEYGSAVLRDSLESKLFGIGSEAFVVGSHEFYLGYAIQKRKFLCLDLGHFHPTESVADKISAILPYVPGLVFHLSRGLRWDSDHVVVFNDEIATVTEEIVRAGDWDRCQLALDYFDAGINRVGAWVVGARAALKGVLRALLLPGERLLAADRDGDGFARLALREEVRTLPLGAVWDQYCLRSDVPPGMEFRDEIDRYESEVLSGRG